MRSCPPIHKVTALGAPRFPTRRNGWHHRGVPDDPVLVAGLEVAAALRRCAAEGFARIEGAIPPSALTAIRAEVDTGPFRSFGTSFGSVRQEIDGYDVELPSERSPLLDALSRELGRVVRRDGRGIRGLATWRPNEVGITHYVEGSIGITPHLDGKWYRRLVVVATIYGRAPFAICGSRDPDDVVERWTAEPGDLLFMRGPGLGGVRDGRPFHLVGTPSGGERLSLGIRMAFPRPS